MTKRVIPASRLQHRAECSRCLNQKDILADLFIVCECEDNPNVHEECL